MQGSFRRTIRYLRLSVTDLCDFRCVYCMAEEGVPKRAHGDILSIEELAELGEAAVRCGVTKIRLTGGEPLVRRGVLTLCERLRALPALRELTLTTNGARLSRMAGDLRAAGVDRLNVSLDTLRSERFRAITRRGELRDVLNGIDAARAAGFPAPKLNTVLLGGVNDDEIADFIALTKDDDVCVRFIELMPMGACAAFPKERFLSADAVLAAAPELERTGEDGVAELYRACGHRGTVGLIRPMSRCFCASCDRLRITADGFLKPCLHSERELPLRGLHGEALDAAIRAGAAEKPERHRLALGRSDTARSMFEIGG
ncbi:MAG: GTP 3',8-cyclase MoaA [Oscillospiraceae bacterium]|nr:GTP 3',8-cyclase MoaA [Oscillospiraceae bacterium]